MTTDFKQIEFNPNNHTYSLNGEKLTPVTTIIKHFQKPFDRDAVAQRVSVKELRAKAEIIAEWEAKAERSRTIGTAIHSHIEQVLRGNTVGQLELDPFLSLNTMLPEIVSFNRFWQELCPKVSYSMDHIEWVIGDHEFGIAGIVDTMLFSPETGKYHIWDWKSGNFDLHNKWENLLHPFGYLDATKLHIYSLQVSLYRLIVERNTGLQLGDSYLVHLTADGHQVHRAVDLRSHLSDWFGGKKLTF
jgi:ATP-dependent exoDNAse (exonuclease V) beta subunit